MSSTAVSTATTSSGAAGATNTCATPVLYDIPINDTACGVPSGGNHTDVMAKCCESADVVSYNNGCGLYCLAIDQSVDDVTKCLFANGIPFQDGFCNSEGNATATATGNSSPTASGASVVSGAASASRTGSGASSSSTSASAAAPVRGVSALGVTVSGLLLSSVMLGVLQL